MQTLKQRIETQRLLDDAAKEGGSPKNEAPVVGASTTAARLVNQSLIALYCLSIRNAFENEAHLT